MYTTITVRQLLERKGYQVWSIGPDSSVFEALQLMSEKNVGALLVIQDKKPLGIFSERDYARKVVLRGLDERQTPVRDVMSSRVISVAPAQTLTECMALIRFSWFLTG